MLTIGKNKRTYQFKPHQIQLKYVKKYFVLRCLLRFKLHFIKLHFLSKTQSLIDKIKMVGFFQ